jgi:pyruvate decarboxylase
VLCNEGYTIERYIHGMNESYNDIQEWDFKAIPPTFGAKDNYKGYQVKSRSELEKLFADAKFASAPYLQVGGKSNHILLQVLNQC